MIYYGYRSYNYNTKTPTFSTHRSREGLTFCDCCGSTIYTEDPDNIEVDDDENGLDWCGITPEKGGIVLAEGHIGEEQDGRYTVTHLDTKAGPITISIQNRMNDDE